MSGRSAKCGAFFSDRRPGRCLNCRGTGTDLRSSSNTVKVCPCEGCAKGFHATFDLEAQRRSVARRRPGDRATNTDVFTRTVR